MTFQTKLKVFSSDEFRRRWSARAWKDTPSIVIAFPFPGAVLFGAENRDTGETTSFFVSPEDAHNLGIRMIAAATKAGAK